MLQFLVYITITRLLALPPTLLTAFPPSSEVPRFTLQPGQHLGISTTQLSLEGATCAMIKVLELLANAPLRRSTNTTSLSMGE